MFCKHIITKQQEHKNYRSPLQKKELSHQGQWYKFTVKHRWQIVNNITNKYIKIYGESKMTKFL